MGGLPYMIVGFSAAALIWRAPSLEYLAKLSAFVPVAYGCVLALFVQVVGYDARAHLTAGDYARQLSSTALAGAIFSGAYVAIAWSLWKIARRLKVVRNEFVP